MKAGFLQSCLFLYPDWPTYVIIDGVKKPLLSIRVNSETEEIEFYGEDASGQKGTRDLE